MTLPQPSRPESAEKPIPRRWGLISLIALLALALAPCIVLTVKAGAHTWVHFFWGAGTWGIAVAIKRTLARWLNRALDQKAGQIFHAASQGLLSSLLELGAAALYLWRLDSADLFTVLAFGAGAGSAEVVYVLAAGSLAKPDPQKEVAWARNAWNSFCVRYQVPIERLFAVIGHIGSRGLVYVGLHGSAAEAILWLSVALLFFTAVDGVATYGHVRNWDWSEPATCRRAHGFFAVISISELLLFLGAFAGRAARLRFGL
jgi:hypothetical protein